VLADGRRERHNAHAVLRLAGSRSAERLEAVHHVHRAGQGRPDGDRRARRRPLLRGNRTHGGARPYGNGTVSCRGQPAGLSPGHREVDEGSASDDDTKRCEYCHNETFLSPLTHNFLIS
jgi:hypothetical protein